MSRIVSPPWIFWFSFTTHSFFSVCVFTIVWRELFVSSNLLMQSQLNSRLEDLIRFFTDGERWPQFLLPEDRWCLWMMPLKLNSSRATKSSCVWEWCFDLWCVLRWDLLHFFFIIWRRVSKRVRKVPAAPQVLGAIMMDLTSRRNVCHLLKRRTQGEPGLTSWKLPFGMSHYAYFYA